MSDRPSTAAQRPARRDSDYCVWRPQRGIALAVAIFAVMFAVYGWKQAVGLTPNIINTAANKGVLLALVAMAQTLPVLTGGLDLSVGMIFVLANCLASVIVVGDPLSDRARRHRRPARRVAVRRAQRYHHRLWPAAADHRHPGDGRASISASRSCCARNRAAASISISPTS